MLETDIRAFVGALGQKFSDQHRTGWVVSTCPLAFARHTHGGKDKSTTFGVKVEEGEPFCSCFACDFHGRLSDVVLELHHLGSENPNLGALLQSLDGLPIVDVKSIAKWEEQAWKQEEHLFPEWMREAMEPAYCGDDVHPYLAGRKVAPGIAWMLDIRWDDHRQRIVFPIRDFKGRLRGLHGRAIHDNIEPRYRMYPFENKTNPHVWLGETWVDFEKPVLMVESVFDLARAIVVYPNVVSPLRASLNKMQLDRMKGARRVITLFDADKAGDQARSKVLLSFKDRVIAQLTPPEGFKDPGSMPEEKIAELIAPYL